MALASGSLLGPYEILAPAGAGGMGEVYRARDTRLDRTVAIKVLPAEFSADPQFRERFDREARAIAALEHPHICALYDVGLQDGTSFLVMQYLEGETLADRLTRGPLPLDQAIHHAIQIADALDKAHRAGIVHRDLKPGNIMLTKSGVKLLDFGLAKASTRIASAGLSMLPTTPPALTAEGAILGTLQYMAPEQLEGRDTDERTDIFAFGAVVYEMVTGKRAFEGRSQASLISSIMSSQPPAVSSWQAVAPAALDHVVARCLAKDAENRWQSAHDLKLQLEWILHAGTATPVVTPSAPDSRKSRERIAWAIAFIAALGLAAVSGAWLWQRSREVPAPVSQLMIVAPVDARFAFDIFGQAISPDGRYVVFSAARSTGTSLLWLRPFDSATPRPLPGTDDGTAPFWSPDGRSIGFFAQGKLKRVDLESGSPQILADAPYGMGGTWSPNGVIVFAPNLASALMRVSAAGGTVMPVTHFNKNTQEYVHSNPFFLPDGTHFLFYVASQEPGAYVGSLESQEVKLVARTDSAAVYAPPGYLLFANGTTLMAQPFDAESLSTRGDPSRVFEQVSRFITAAGFSVSNSGVLLIRPATPLDTELAWFDRQGMRLGAVAPPGQYLDIALSPDENQIAFDRVEGAAPDVWIMDLRRRATSRLTSNPSVDNVPVWSADGRVVAFASERGSGLDIYQRPVNQSEPDQPLLKLNVPPIMFPSDWSSDGRYLMYYRTDPKNKNDVWVVPLFGERTPFAVLQSEFNEWQAQFSPDGKWIAYVSDQSGIPQVYVQAFPTQTGTWPISVAGGTQPRWRRDGSELFYLAPDRKLMAVAVKAAATFEADSPRPLFETTLDTTQFRQTYAVSNDGKRFLLNAMIETSAPPLTVVQNWPALLKR
jgi:eukaryotic-like serine/threonine-protein kinase